LLCAEALLELSSASLAAFCAAVVPCVPHWAILYIVYVSLVIAEMVDMINPPFLENLESAILSL
jgi:hypothetical protein